MHIFQRAVKNQLPIASNVASVQANVKIQLKRNDLSAMPQCTHRANADLDPLLLQGIDIGKHLRRYFRGNLLIQQGFSNVKNNGFVFQRLTEMMQDKDIKDLLSRHFAPEITSLKNYARILSEYYPVSNDVFENDKKMPKAIGKFIDTVENFGKEKTEEELER